MASIVAFSLACLASYFAMEQQTKISNTTISAPPPLPSPAEGALFADIAAPSVDNIESFPTMDLPVHVLTVASSSLEASSSSFPFALVAALAFSISCFLYFGYLFSDFDPTGAIQYGEDLLDASIDDLEHGPQAPRVEPLDTDRVELKHHLDRLELFVDSLLEAETKAKKSEADAKAAIEKARSETSSVQAELDNVKSSLVATSEQHDKAHSLVSEMTGKNNELAKLHTALQKEVDSLRNELAIAGQALTRKASEATQTSQAAFDSLKEKNARLMNQTNALKSDKEALQSELEETKSELMMESTRRGNERKLHAPGQERAAQQKKERDALLARCESLQKELAERKITNTEDLQTERDAALVRRDLLEKELAEMKVATEDLQTERDDLRSSESELLVAQEELEKQLEAERVKLQSEVSERQGLRAQLNSAQNALRSANTSAAELQEANTRLNENNADLQKRVQTAEQSLRSKIEEGNANQMSLYDRLVEAEAQRDSAREALGELRSRQKPGSQELEQIQKLTDEVDELRGQLMDIEGLKSFAELEFEEAQNQLASASPVNAEASDISELQQKYESLEKKYQSIQDELNQKEKARDELKDTLHAKKSAGDDFLEATRRVKELEEENAKLRDNSKMQRALDEKEEALQKANGAVQQHQEGLARRNKKISDLNKELEVAKQQAVSPSQLQQYCEQAQQEAIDKEHKNGLHHYAKLEREHRAKLAELAEAAAEQQSALDAATFAAEQIAKKLRTLCLMLKYSKLWLDRWRNSRANTNQDDAGDDDQKPEDYGGDQNGQDGDESKKNDDHDAGGPDGEAKDDGAYDDSQPDGGEDEDAPGEDEDEYDYSVSYGEDVESVNATDNTVEPTVTPNEVTTGTNGPISLADSLPTLADNDTATDIDELIIPKWWYGNKRGGRGNVTEQKKGQKKRRKHNDDTESSTVDTASTQNSAANMNPSAAVTTPESTNTLTQASPQALGQSSSVSSPSTSSAPSMPRQAQNLSFRSTHADTRETPRQIQYQAPHQLQYQAPQPLQYEAPYQPQHWAPPQLPYQSPHQAQYQTYHQAQYQAPSQPQYRSPNHMSTSIQPPRQPYGFSGPSNWASQSRYSNSHPAQRRRY
ncbi:hypothetical protein CKM354_000284900 [Cercospora kikuchii]|uniref:Uncharacterized protein n=1 Tax=Cercospora kikuchii TaxID=84275 RepID=A0A9P3FD67_9PEZI|nr:uncharacterized protein CKM354_000284900 [Cercospora kikuchii]GIZ39467.1 hypothetical protein CKM354_000284900 [Cercospora kikuchii]